MKWVLKNSLISGINLHFCHLKYAYFFQKSKPKWIYGFLATAAEPKLRVREKIFLTKVIDIYNSYKL